MRVVILGAAGRDFHDFNVVYRDDPAAEVVAFTERRVDTAAVRGRRGASSDAVRRSARGPRAAVQERRRLADVVVITKEDTVAPARIEAVRRAVGRLASRAQIIDARLPITVDDPAAAQGSLREVFAAYPTLGPVLPTTGYGTACRCVIGPCACATRPRPAAARRSAPP